MRASTQGEDGPARTGAARLALDLPRPAEVSLRVYDALGRLLYERPAAPKPVGWAQALPLPTLAPGVYGYVVAVEGRSFGGTFTVAK